MAMTLPNQLKQQQKSMADKYVWFKNIWSIGETPIGFFKNLINLSGAISILTFIGVFYPTMREYALYATPFFIGGYIVFIVFLGITLDNRKIVQRETKFITDRNEALNRIEERLEWIDNALLNISGRNRRKH